MRRETKQLLNGMAWAADAVRKWALVTLAIVLAFYASALLAGCTATCAAIDIAHHGCAVLRYHDKLGREREVVLTHEEVDEYGREMAMKHADAGVP